MLSAKQQLIQSVGEALIPLLGFYFWHWDLHFIFLFYYLDMLTFCVFAVFKLTKITHYRSEYRWGNNLLYLNKLLAIFILAIFLMEVAISYLYPELNLWRSLLHFLTVREWGIPQIVLLIPLLVFANYQAYKLLFLANGTFRNISTRTFSNDTFFAAFLVLLGSGSFLACVYFGIRQVSFGVWFSVLLKFAFDMAIYPLWKRKQKELP